MLGAARRRRRVPSLRRQLRALRMSSSLVSAIRPLHVPVPGRGVLPRRLARLGPAGARSFRIPVQSRERSDHDSGRRNAHAGAGRIADAKGTAMRLISSIGQWFDQRLQLAGPIREASEHRVPRHTASWRYVVGSAGLIVLALQIVTGILFALTYVPSAGEASNSLQDLNHYVTRGWVIRALNGR